MSCYFIYFYYYFKFRKKEKSKSYSHRTCKNLCLLLTFCIFSHSRFEKEEITKKKREKKSKIIIIKLLFVYRDGK